VFLSLSVSQRNAGIGLWAYVAGKRDHQVATKKDEEDEPGSPCLHRWHEARIAAEGEAAWGRARKSAVRIDFYL